MLCRGEKIEDYGGGREALFVLKPVRAAAGRPGQKRYDKWPQGEPIGDLFGESWRECLPRGLKLN